jgi:hypothetical protein
MFQPDGKSIVAKLLLKYPPEVDALQLQKILKAHWKGKVLQHYLAETYVISKVIQGTD